MADDALYYKDLAPLEPGRAALGLSMRQYARDRWVDSQGKQWLMQDASGVSRTVKGLRFELSGLWRAGDRHAFDFALPYQYQEFSAGAGDGTARKGDGVGDFSLGWRARVLGSEESCLGLRAALSIPSGLSSFAAQHPLVGAGSGSLEAQAGIQAQGRLAENWPLWIQAAGLFDLGADADIATGVFKGYGAGGEMGFAGGREFVRRQPGMSLGLGMGYVWHRGESARHLVVVDALAMQEGALEIAGMEVAETRRVSLEVLPQARFDFGAFAFSVGWQLPFFLSRSRAEAEWGELLLKADFKL